MYLTMSNPKPSFVFLLLLLHLLFPSSFLFIHHALESFTRLKHLISHIQFSTLLPIHRSSSNLPRFFPTSRSLSLPASRSLLHPSTAVTIRRKAASLWRASSKCRKQAIAMSSLIPTISASVDFFWASGQRQSSNPSSLNPRFMLSR